MFLKPGGSFAFLSFTTNPTTGAAQDADSLPTAALYRNGTLDAGVTVTVTKISTGFYKCTGTVGAYSATDICQIVMTATVGSVAGSSVAGEFVVDLQFTSDTYSRIGTNGAGLTALGDARLAHLDADITSRSTFAGGAVASVTAAVSLSSGDEALLAKLIAMISGSGGTAAFTNTALANAPTGGSAPTAAAIRQEIDTNSTQLAALVAGELTASAVVTALKADTEWKTMLAGVNGVYDYDETTHILTLKDKTGTTTFAILTLTPGTNNYTHRASA